MSTPSSNFKLGHLIGFVCTNGLTIICVLLGPCSVSTGAQPGACYVYTGEHTGAYYVSTGAHTGACYEVSIGFRIITPPSQLISNGAICICLYIQP